MINSMKCISDYNGQEEKDRETLWDAESGNAQEKEVARFEILSSKGLGYVVVVCVWVKWTRNSDCVLNSFLST